MHVSVGIFRFDFGYCFASGLVWLEVVSVMIVGRRVGRPRVSAFLLVVSTPPRGLGWSIHAGMSCFGGLELGPRMVLPR